MKTTMHFLGIMITLAAHAHGQGRIVIDNSSAPTRLWSIDGPPAGPGIWGQMLAGPTPGSLMAVGPSAEHRGPGIVFIGIAEVPTVPCSSFGYAQFFAWDGTLWGTSFDAVPADQFGKTEIVSVYMTCEPIPTFGPIFTQPAIVPVPEPSMLGLAGLMLGLAFMLPWTRRTD